MRKYKTSKKSRTTYKYYDADGNIVSTLVSGEDGVTEELIEFLHCEDDKTVDSNRREDYRIVFHLEGYKDENGEDNMESHPLLADDTYHPEVLYMKEVEDREWQEKLNKVSLALEELTEKQKNIVIKKFFEEKTNVEIAKEENVSEAAIRKSFKQALKKLKKFF